MKRRFLPVALLAAMALPVAPAMAVPDAGVFYQPIPGSSGNIQLGIPDGVLQIDYAPSLNNQHLLQGAIRLPAPLLGEPLSLNGLIGYRHLWGVAGDGASASNGGIEVGLSAKLPFSRLVGGDSPASAFGLYAFGLYNQIVFGEDQWRFDTSGPALITYGAGLSYELPTGAAITVGLENLAVPTSVGSWSTGVSNYTGLIVGYRW